MALQVVNGASLKCTGAFPPGLSSLTVLPMHRVTAGGQPAANIMDHKPLVNVQTFGMCIMPSNPQVAAATAAAMGVLTPQPCMPQTQTPWIPGSPTVLVNSQPALTNACQCMCLWGGVVTVIMPGQMTVAEP